MNTTITRWQLFFVIIKTQIGIGLLSLPSEIQGSAKGDAWISVLVAGCAIQLLLLVYGGLMKRFPGDTLSQMTRRMFGNYAGLALNVICFVFFILIAAYACSLYVHLIRTWLLPLTPVWVLLLMIIATSVYLALENIRVIARFFVLASVLFVILILISLLTFTNEMHISNVLPIGQSGMMQVFQGSEKTFFSMLGFEVMLYFFPAVEKQPKGVLKIALLANGFVTLFYTYFVFICLISYSTNALAQVNEPVLFLFKGLAYQLLDRLDLIFLSLWIIPMTSTIVSYLALAGKSMTTGQIAYRRMVWISGLLVFLIGMYMALQENLDPFSKWLEYGYLMMIAALPLLIYLGAFLLKNKGKGGTA